jgi:hypothetical protein
MLLQQQQIMAGKTKKTNPNPPPKPKPKTTKPNKEETQTTQFADMLV